MIEGENEKKESDMTQVLGKNQQGGHEMADPWILTEPASSPSCTAFKVHVRGKALCNVPFLLQRKRN